MDVDPDSVSIDQGVSQFPFRPKRKAKASGGELGKPRRGQVSVPLSAEAEGQWIRKGSLKRYERKVSVPLSAEAEGQFNDLNEGNESYECLSSPFRRSGRSMIDLVDGQSGDFADVAVPPSAEAEGPLFSASGPGVGGKKGLSSPFRRSGRSIDLIRQSRILRCRLVSVPLSAEAEGQ